MTDHAVVIAGGGPTGLMLAAELAIARVDVDVVVERRAKQEPSATRRRPNPKRDRDSGSPNRVAFVLVAVAVVALELEVLEVGGPTGDPVPFVMYLTVSRRPSARRARLVALDDCDPLGV